MSELPKPIVDRGLLVRFALGLLFVLVVAGVTGVLFKGPITDVSRTVMDIFGAPGVALAVLVADTWPLPPLVHEPILVVAYASGMNFWVVLTLAGVATWLSALLCYACGRAIGMRGLVKFALERSGVAPIMQDRGLLVIVLASLTPIPFAPCAWAAGALKLPFGPYAVACLLRIVKVASYFTLFVLGWNIS